MCIFIKIYGMKFTCSVDVNLPLDKVAFLFEDEDSAKHWQDHFESITLISGEKRVPGSKYRIQYGGKRPFELIETLLIYEMPYRFKGLYEHKKMSNTMDNRMEVLTENTTRWTAEIEYTIMKGPLKFFAWLMPGMFKKQTQKWLDQFKQYAEQYDFKI